MSNPQVATFDFIHLWGEYPPTKLFPFFPLQTNFIALKLPTGSETCPPNRGGGHNRRKKIILYFHVSEHVGHFKAMTFFFREKLEIGFGKKLFPFVL